MRCVLMVQRRWSQNPFFFLPPVQFLLPSTSHPVAGVWVRWLFTPRWHTRWMGERQGPTPGQFVFFNLIGQSAERSLHPMCHSRFTSTCRVFLWGAKRVKPQQCEIVWPIFPTGSYCRTLNVLQRRSCYVALSLSLSISLSLNVLNMTFAVDWALKTNLSLSPRLSLSLSLII